MRQRERTSQGRRAIAWSALACGLTLAVLAVPGAAGARTPGADPGLPSPLNAPAAFRQPPALARPLFRWWWSATPLDKGELVKEVDAMAAEGFGGAEIAFGTGTWATAAQREGLAAVLAEAKRLGLHIDMTFGASWPITTPATAPATGLSEQELQYGDVSVSGPAPYSGPVPAPFDDPTNSKGAKLVAVTAAKVQSEGDPAVPVDPGAPNAGVMPTAPQSPPVLDPSSLVDLTKQAAGGSITWTPPSPGHWLLFGLWSRPSSQNVMNEFYAPSAVATDKYLDGNQIGDASSLLPGVGRDFFEDSLELDANLFWAPDMLARFRALRGYDLAKYLPLLFVQGYDNYPVPVPAPKPDFDLPGALGDRVRHDFYATLQDLYETQHIQPFEQWARSHGMDFRTQAAYGAPLDATGSARAVVEAGGIADDESLNAGDPMPLTDPQWRFAFDHFRSVVAGVHQADGKEINTELGAQFFGDEQWGLGDYKAAMDKEWAAGITRPILHGFDYQHPGAAWPGDDNFSGIVAQSWNQNTMPQFSMFAPLTGYWARGNMVLQAGRPRIDVAVLRDGYLTTAATYPALGTDETNNQVSPSLPGDPLHDNEGRPVVDDTAGNVPGVRPGPLFDGEPLERAGYTMEYLDPAGLTDPRAAGNGTLYPGGPDYKAVVVDQSALSGAAARALADQAARGLRVVFVGDVPSAGTGAGDPSGEDAQVKAAIARALQQPTVARVAAQADVLGALRKLGVAPDVAWSGAHPVYSQHRSSASADYYYLWNAGPAAESFTASLVGTGAPSDLDLWTGAITPLGQYATDGDRTRVPITLQPGQTMVVALSHTRRAPLHAVAVSGDGASVASEDGGLEVRDSRAGTHTVQLSDGRSETVTVPDAPAPVTPTTWKLHVAATGPDGTTPYDLTLTKLDDWRNISQISGESGTGTYTTTLDLPAEWASPRVGAVLDLGTADGAIQAFVNGHRVAPDVDPDHAFDVTGQLHPGANTLTVVLTTTLKNKIVSESRSGGLFGTYLVQPATQPYGLLGPVALRAYGRAPIGR